MLLWRVSPWALLIGLLVALDRSIHLALTSEKITKNDKFFIIVVLIAITVLLNYGWGVNTHRFGFLWLMAIPLAIIVGWIYNKFISKDFFTRQRETYTSLVILTIITMILGSISGLRFSHIMLFTLFLQHKLKWRNGFGKILRKNLFLLLPLDEIYTNMCPEGSGCRFIFSLRYIC